MKQIRIVMIAMMLALILVACDSADSGSDADTESTIAVEEQAPTPTQETEQQDPPADAQAEQVEPTDVPVEPTEVTQADGTTAQTVAYVGESWTQLPLTNVATGETFTFADFAGQTVFVHPMAVWCTNCRANQRLLNSAVVPEVGDNVVFVSLSIEPFEEDANLAQYAENNGFSWVFAVVTQEMFVELRSVFGGSISNPPVQPHFIINPDGSHDGLRTGGVNATALLAELNQAG